MSKKPRRLVLLRATPKFKDFRFGWRVRKHMKALWQKPSGRQRVKTLPARLRMQEMSRRLRIAPDKLPMRYHMNYVMRQSGPVRIPPLGKATS